MTVRTVQVNRRAWDDEEGGTFGNYLGRGYRSTGFASYYDYDRTITLPKPLIRMTLTMFRIECECGACAVLYSYAEKIPTLLCPACKKQLEALPAERPATMELPRCGTCPGCGSKINLSGKTGKGGLKIFKEHLWCPLCGMDLKPHYEKRLEEACEEEEENQTGEPIDESPESGKVSAR